MSVKDSIYKNYLKCKTILEGNPKKDYQMASLEAKKEVSEILLKDGETCKDYIERTDDSDPDREFYRIYQRLAFLCAGILYIQMQQYSKGESCLKKCLDLIENPLDPKAAYASIVARNHLGHLSLASSKPEEALKFLKEAANIYRDFRSGKISAENIFGDMGDVTRLGEDDLEVAYGKTMLCLADTYNLLNDAFNSMVCCHESLRAELKSKEFCPIVWARNAVNLSGFFLSKDLFKQSKCLLAAANHVLDEYEKSFKNMEGSQEEMDTKKDELRQAAADLSFFWAKYGIYILQYYKSQNFGITFDDDNIDDEKLEVLKNLTFEGLDLTLYEDQITAEDVATFEEAREVFLFSQRQLNRAKEYYTFQDFASFHVDIVQNHSRLFKFLSEYEPDEGRQFKMLKKRAKMLEAVSKELNPTYYMDVCRQLWFELGEVYHDMMQIKLKDAEKLPQNSQTSKKVNSLNECSAKNFHHFLDSVKDKKTGKLPDPLREDIISPALTAHFYLGRLHFRYITSDKHSRAKNSKKACEFFNYLVNYCDKSEEAKVIAGDKYQICKNLTQLLQLSLLQL